MDRYVLRLKYEVKKMGMHSYINYQELHLIDKKKFMDWVIALKCCNDDYWILDEFDFDAVEFTFESAKIQGYWYDGMCKFFEKMRDAGLRGEVEFEYECSQLFKIYFTDEAVYVYLGPEYEYDDKLEVNHYRENIDEDDNIGIYVIHDGHLCDISGEYPDCIVKDENFWENNDYVLSYKKYMKQKVREEKENGTE